MRAEDIGKARAAATLPRLAELNAYVPVRDLGGKAGDEVTVALIKGFHVSVIVFDEFYIYLIGPLGRSTLWGLIQEATGDQQLDAREWCSLHCCTD